MHGCDIIYIKGPDLRHRLGIRMLLRREDRQALLCRMKFIISRGWIYANYPDNNSDHARSILVIVSCYSCLSLSFLSALNIMQMFTVKKR